VSITSHQARQVRRPPVEATTILLDLDGTLLPDEDVVDVALARASVPAAAEYGVSPVRLAAAVRAAARAIWVSGPYNEYCLRIGISSWEGLWCRFEGSGAEVGGLRNWAPTYRFSAWANALSQLGVGDNGLAAELADRFPTERRRLLAPYPEVDTVLSLLKERFTLALITNGASCLQREKLSGSGLSGYFGDRVFVSSEIGYAKPAREIFDLVLRAVQGTPRSALMVGDSLERDINGAINAGLKAIWINRSRQNQAEASQIPVIADLNELASLVSNGPADQQVQQSSTRKSRGKLESNPS
jgi:putative hydrolase of the HAD superfamily